MTPKKRRGKRPPLKIFKGARSRPDLWFVGAFILLLTIGMVMLSSASAVVSFQKFGNPYYYLTHQLLYGLIPGFVAFYLASKIDYHIWKKFAFPFMVISILLLIAVFIPGLGFSHGGARRWVTLGPVLFQPAEIVKLTFLLYLGTWLSSKGKLNVKNFSYGFLPFLVLVGIIGLLVILQPDMGTLAVIVLVSFIMYFIAGARLWHVGIAALGGVGLFTLLIKTASYRLQRFMTFLHPELDPLGVGYHINQALLAVGSGGILGRGFGHSRQKFAYLPEAFGDSIFAIIAEELGFVFGVILIGLFIFLAMRGLKIAKKAPDDFGRYIVVGIISWILFQTFVNIGAMVSLTPLTGIPLPFISYGGTALIISMFAIGLVVNVSRQSKTEADKTNH